MKRGQVTKGADLDEAEVKVFSTLSRLNTILGEYVIELHATKGEIMVLVDAECDRIFSKLGITQNCSTCLIKELALNDPEYDTIICDDCQETISIDCFKNWESEKLSEQPKRSKKVFGVGVETVLHETIKINPKTKAIGSMKFIEPIDQHPLVVCPKCEKDYLHIGFFHEADNTGVDAMVVHSMKTVNGPFGSHEAIDEKCFISTKEVGIENPIMQRDRISEEEESK